MQDRERVPETVRHRVDEIAVLEALKREGVSAHVEREGPQVEPRGGCLGVGRESHSAERPERDPRAWDIPAETERIRSRVAGQVAAGGVFKREVGVSALMAENRVEPDTVVDERVEPLALAERIEIGDEVGLRARPECGKKGQRQE